MVFALKNSTTILLPWWYTTLTAHNLPHHMMSQDVSTWWNLMFNMLDFALKYRWPIDTMAATWDFDLHKYELVPIEWRIAGELQDVLQVCPFHPSHLCAHSEAHSSTDFQRCNPLRFARNPEPGDCNPCYGSQWQNPHYIFWWFSQVLHCCSCCSCHWPEGDELVLQQDWSLRHLSDCHGHLFLLLAILLLIPFLVLHPCHKLEYFKRQRWEVLWIQDAQEIICHKFDHSYAPACHGCY